MSVLWCSDSGDGDVLLALHPGGTDTRALGPLLAELTGTYRVLAPEQRGHGRTPDRDGEWHFADMAADTAALLDGLSMRRVHVVGWSDGAIVGLHLALARPELVASLVFGHLVVERNQRVRAQLNLGDRWFACYAAASSNLGRESDG